MAKKKNVETPEVDKGICFLWPDEVVSFVNMKGMDSQALFSYPGTGKGPRLLMFPYLQPSYSHPTRLAFAKNLSALARTVHETDNDLPWEIQYVGGRANSCIENDLRIVSARTRIPASRVHRQIFDLHMEQLVHDPKAYELSCSRRQKVLDGKIEEITDTRKQAGGGRNSELFRKNMQAIIKMRRVIGRYSRLLAQNSDRNALLVSTPEAFYPEGVLPYYDVGAYEFGSWSVDSDLKLWTGIGSSPKVVGWGPIPVFDLIPVPD